MFWLNDTVYEQGKTSMYMPISCDCIESHDAAGSIKHGGYNSSSQPGMPSLLPWEYPTSSQASHGGQAVTCSSAFASPHHLVQASVLNYEPP